MQPMIEIDAALRAGCMVEGAEGVEGRAEGRAVGRAEGPRAGDDATESANNTLRWREKNHNKYTITSHCRQL